MNSAKAKTIHKIMGGYKRPEATKKETIWGHRGPGLQSWCTREKGRKTAPQRRAQKEKGN